MGIQWGYGLFFLLVIMSFAVNTNICTGAGNATTGCPAEERLALLKFKNSLRKDVGMLSSWIGKDCCQWEGVGCNGIARHVVKLDLRGSYYSSVEYEDEYYLVGNGKVNSALANLKHLNYLDLSGNNFAGSKIPHFIGSLKHLRYLNLSDAGFSGVIPHHLGNLSNLNVLDLGGNYGLIADDVSWVFRISSLRHLDLRVTDLSGAQNIDKILYMIPSLIEVHLSYCSLSNYNLPSLAHLNSSHTLSKIQLLDLGWNSFEGRFPSFLVNMTSLESLDLSGYKYSDQARSSGNILNLFTSLSELHLSSCNLLNTHLSPSHLNFSTRSKFHHLDLSWNSLEGKLPSSLTNISSLRILDLSWNRLYSSIIVINPLVQLYLKGNEFHHIEHIGIWNQCHLKLLDLSFNNFQEEMVGPSANVSECVQYDLETLDLSHNQFTGPIPESLGKLTALEVLNLESNNLIGPIPTSLGKLTALKKLSLRSNGLRGTIPNLRGKLTGLEELSLDSNYLSGPIPVSLGQLTNLRFLDVSNNSLEGLVSETQFANLSMLKYLDATSNVMLTFNISPAWVPPFQLRYIRLGSCKIAAEFPDWIKTQRKLQELVLSNTSISGPLPTWLEGIPGISKLDISHNLIHGQLTNLPRQLEFLFLQNNLLNGSISKSLCKITSIRYLDISRNRLLGELPQCLEKLQHLTVMVLSSNRLSGVIPSLPSSRLEWLQLNNNTFHGEIPLSMRNCTALRAIDLGDNKMSGTIPKWLGGSLTELRILRLNENNFSGSIPGNLCRNFHLQILDFADNSLTGVIPRCFGELLGMSTPELEFFVNFTEFEQSMTEIFQGIVLEYTRNLQYVVNMDLSSNNLVGEIPKELTSLHGLLGLNLSHNLLSGGIPDRIGDMKSLISLDLSVNKLSGRIPPSLRALNFLSHLNLSHNNLSGRIPTSNQLQTLVDPSSYDGNEALCGPPLPKSCSNDEDSATRNNSKNDKGDDDPKKVWFYLDIMSGFATGFWGVIGVLIFKKHWRQTLFTFVEDTLNKIYVAIVVRVAKLKRGTESQ